MAKKTTTRAKREAHEAKSTLFTSAQITKAGLKTYSPSYVQKQYTALLKTLSDTDRKALEANRESEGFTKQDTLLFYQLKKRHDEMRHTIEDEIISGAKLSVGFERELIASRRGIEEHGLHIVNTDIEGAPAVFRTQPILQYKAKSLKSIVKSTIKHGMTPETWKADERKHLRKSVNMAIDNVLWGASRQDELRFLISKMKPETLEKWALAESDATTTLNIQAFSDADDGDVETLEFITDDLVYSAKETLKKYQNYTSRKYKSFA
jgi:hypothetical protein